MSDHHQVDYAKLGKQLEIQFFRDFLETLTIGIEIDKMLDFPPTFQLIFVCEFHECLHICLFLFETYIITCSIFDFENDSISPLQILPGDVGTRDRNRLSGSGSYDLVRRHHRYFCLDQKAMEES